MQPDDFGTRVEGVAALADPVRRALYLYVCAQAGPVSRDEASEGCAVARHTAKFHLDRLAEEGLLDTDFRRPSGRGGPGAGRPTKFYRRSDREVRVTLPERRYDLAGQLLATAVDDAGRDGTSVRDALAGAARAEGTRIGERAAATLPRSCTTAERVDATCEALADLGYEPRRTPGCLLLANCPFHALAQEHAELVCGMNLDLLGAAVERLGDPTIGVRLDPAPDRCCVVVEHA